MAQAATLRPAQIRHHVIPNSAPSRLTGHRLKVRVYGERPDCYLPGTPAHCIPRPRCWPPGADARQLRLPTIALLWQSLRGAPQELDEWAGRRIERHRANPTKTLATVDFSMVPMISNAQVMALAIGDAWCGTVATELLFEPPRAGKNHLGSVIGHAFTDNGYRVMFTRTSELVQNLQATRQSLQLLSALAKIDRSELIAER
jgi:hypothetical protein